MSQRALFVGLLATGLAGAVSAQQVIDLGEETAALSVAPNEANNPGLDGQCGDGFFYESGETYDTGIGRTVGSSGEWEVYQPFVLSEPWELCSIGLDGWYVTGTPNTFNATIYPEDPNNPGFPDRNTPLIPGADFNLGSSGFVDWVDLDVDPLCLEADTMYFVGARTSFNDDHWSAIYRDSSLFGMSSLSYSNDAYCCSAPPIALRMQGFEGCGGVTLEVAGDCPGTIDATTTGASPFGTVAVIYARGLGSVVIPSGPCAGTELGLDATAQLAGTSTADANGTAVLSGRVPQAACGRTFLQSLDVDTCTPSSNVVGI